MSKFGAIAWRAAKVTAVAGSIGILIWDHRKTRRECLDIKRETDRIEQQTDRLIAQGDKLLKMRKNLNKTFEEV